MSDVTANQIAGDAAIMQGDGIEIVLHGQSFRVCDKTPRQTRPLMAEMMRLQPLFLRVAAALHAAGVDEKGNLSPEQVAEIPAEAQADMLMLFDPLCDWIAKCCDNAADVIEALEHATESELVAAFMALKDMLQSPFVRQLKKSKKSGKR